MIPSDSSLIALANSSPIDITTNGTDFTSATQDMHAVITVTSFVPRFVNNRWIDHEAPLTR